MTHHTPAPLSLFCGPAAYPRRDQPPTVLHALVLTFASGASLSGNVTFPAYSTSKGAVVLMTRSVALGHVARGIRANSVCPGPIDTPMLAHTFASAGDAAAEREREFRARNPMGRFGKPAEITAAVLFLLSDAAGYVNGVAMPIDGGRLA